MIFALVGTHEQQFNRLIKLLDELKTDETVLVQTGYSDYLPKRVNSLKFLEFDEVLNHMKKADVVITHAGTGSVMMALDQGMCPLVIARDSKYHEHVDNHQQQIVKSLLKKGQIVSYFEGDSFLEKIEEARLRSQQKKEHSTIPDFRLVDAVSKLLND